MTPGEAGSSPSTPNSRRLRSVEGRQGWCEARGSRSIFGSAVRVPRGRGLGLAVSFGGDGTTSRRPDRPAGGYCGPRDQSRRIGFLAQVDPAGRLTASNVFANGEYQVEERMALAVRAGPRGTSTDAGLRTGPQTRPSSSANAPGHTDPGSRRDRRATLPDLRQPTASRVHSHGLHRLQHVRPRSPSSRRRCVRSCSHRWRHTSSSTVRRQGPEEPVTLPCGRRPAQPALDGLSSFRSTPGMPCVSASPLPAKFVPIRAAGLQLCCRPVSLWLIAARAGCMLVEIRGPGLESHRVSSCCSVPG